MSGGTTGRTTCSTLARTRRARLLGRSRKSASSSAHRILTSCFALIYLALLMPVRLILPLPPRPSPSPLPPFTSLSIHYTARTLFRVLRLRLLCLVLLLRDGRPHEQAAPEEAAGRRAPRAEAEAIGAGAIGGGRADKTQRNEAGGCARREAQLVLHGRMWKGRSARALVKDVAPPRVH